MLAPHSLLSSDLEALVEQLAARGLAGRAVAFDADGTLWSGDVGEELLATLEAKGEVARGSFEEYERKLALAPPEAFAFAVEVMAGLPLAQIRHRATDLFAARSARVFPFTRPVLSRLREAGATVWIVSASARWAVEPGAAALGIDSDHLIGVECEIERGCLTTRIRKPIPCLEGKASLLLERGVRPVVAAGNSRFDVPMLELAEHAIAMVPASVDSPFARLAAEKRWVLQRT